MNSPVHLCIDQFKWRNFQESLNRCVLTCQDQVKDKVTPSTPEAEVNKFRSEFEACAIRCCDDKVNTLPTLSRKVEQTFKSGMY